MTRFRYRAYTSGGELHEGEVEAPSLDAADESLWSLGLTPFETRAASVSLASSGWWKRELFQVRGIKLRDLAAFTREFATLKGAGIPIDDCLLVVSRHGASDLTRRLAAHLLLRVTDGATLSEAMQARQDSFPEDYLNVIRASEASATLGSATSELADMLERRVELQAKLRSALIYPAILLAMACASTAIVVGYLVPNLAPIFADSGKPIPAGLRFVITMESNWTVILGGVIGFAAILYVMLRFVAAQSGGRLFLDRVRLRLPLVGSLFARRETARFSRSLGTLIRAGVPLMQSLAAASAVVTNRHMAAALAGAINAVRDGEGLAKALGAVGSFPQMFLQMIAIGEEAHSLDDMLLRVAGVFEVQIQRDIQRAMTALTPALTLIIAGIVGSLILTVMNAILSINELAAQ